MKYAEWKVYDKTINLNHKMSASFESELPKLYIIVVEFYKNYCPKKLKKYVSTKHKNIFFLKFTRIKRIGKFSKGLKLAKSFLITLSQCCYGICQNLKLSKILNNFSLYYFKGCSANLMFWISAMLFIQKANKIMKSNAEKEKDFSLANPHHLHLLRLKTY